MMRLLAQRVPLTLLLDLAAPPDALELYASEGGDVSWLPPQRGASGSETRAATASRSGLPDANNGSASTSTS